MLRSTRIAALLFFAVSGAGCFLKADDDAPPPNPDWTFPGAEPVLLVGSTQRVELRGPTRCTGGTFGIGSTCTFTTIDSVVSLDPGVFTVEGVSENVAEVRAVAPGSATLTVRGTTPDGEPTEGTATIRVGAAASAALEVFTACGDGVNIDQVAFPPEASIGLVATFKDAAGNSLAGNGDPPFALSPASAGAIEGTIVDGHTDFVSLDLAHDVTAPEVALTLLDGKELERFAIANGSTIDGFEMGETTFNPNLNEVYVHARLAVGARHVCFGEYDYPFSLEYHVDILTPAVCDAGFGELTTRGVAGFALSPISTGDCVVTMRFGSLEKTLTVPVIKSASP
ncbi:MAG: hypothetical protein U0414_20035 [Polyangiaceae bacterium]